MNKLLKRDVSAESVMFYFGGLVLILMIIAMSHYKTKSEGVQGTQQAIIVEALKSGVNKDSLKKAIIKSDTLNKK